MAISFARPWVLLLLPPLIFITLYWWRQSRLRPGYPRISILLRLTIVTLLVLALAQVSWSYRVSRQAVAFIADMSDSALQAKPQMEKFIREAIKKKDPEDRVAVITFGKQPLVDVPPSRDPLFDTLEAAPNGNYTNIARALQLAGALAPAGYRKRVVLLSDGRENLGKAVDVAAGLKMRGIRVDVVPVAGNTANEVLVDRVEAPETVREGEKIPLEISVQSSFATGAEIFIYRDKTLAGRKRVYLDKGDNKFLLSQVAGEAGFYPFKVEVHAPADGETRNNTGYALTRVEGPPRILVVSTGGENSSLAKVLSPQFQVDVRLPAVVPRTETELGKYDSIVLDNVPAYDLPQSFMDAVQVCVRDLGTGLVMLGGKNSFGVGGYYRTPVEAALPVHMDLRGKKELPSLGLMLVIDKSGSMGGDPYGAGKMELAKEAAIRSTQVLMPKDQVGVLAFDGAVYPVVELGAVADLKRIQQNIASIGAGGGTNIYPALELAVEKLASADTRLKHIILLTDGRSATGGSYRELAKRMNEQSITLTTVAVGRDADTELLSTLARWGKGRYYFTADAASVPKIFTKETMLVSRSYLVEEEFTPRLTAVSPVMDGFQSLPSLYGYVATTPKRASRVILSSHKQDPVLATWQYGLGRTAAWTSDVQGLWSGNWINWPGFDLFFSQLVTWTLPRHQESDMIVRTEITGGQGKVLVDTPQDLTATKELRAKIIGPGGYAREADLAQVGPGLYAGRFPVEKPGVYLVQVLDQTGGTVKMARLSGVTAPYSPEYRRAQDPGVLQAVAAAGGGEVLTSPEAAFAGNLPPVSGELPLWPKLLAAAALLWPVDIALRRLTFGRHQLGKVKKYFSGKRPARTREVPAETFARLKREKSRLRREQAVWVKKDGIGEQEEKPEQVFKERPPKSQSPAGKETGESNRSTGGNSSYTSRLLDAKRRARAGGSNDFKT